jgi:DNA-binding transcriptional LysR family regulator
VADRGSFAKAARELRLSPAAVTRAITALEDRLGARLLLRTTRSVRLTEAGARFLADTQRILQDIGEAEEAAAGAHAAPRGILTVTAPVIFGRIYVAPLLRDWLDLHPAASAHALFVDRVVSLTEEGVDVAIRIGDLPDSSLTAIKVGFVRRVVFGSPAYFARHGIPQHPDDLARHRIITVDNGALKSVDWRFADGRITARIPSRLSVTTLDTAIDTALSGWALARTLSYQVAPHVADGALRIVLREFEPRPLPIHVVHQEGRRASAKLRSFIDFAVGRLRATPAIQGE